MIQPADEGFYHEVKEEWGERVPLESATLDGDFRRWAVGCEEDGGCALVEIPHDFNEVSRKAKEGQDIEELFMVHRGVGALEVNVAHVERPLVVVGVLYR